jgi:hypothetical protein
MKKLFLAIRHNDLQQVKDIISKKPDLVHCTAKQPPKKDDGQSPLQVALKTPNFDIADYLLDMGADPNFMESENCVYNDWRAPALHDAICAAVMESRWSVKRGGWGGKPVYYEVMSKPEVTEHAYRVLERMISLGGDVNKLDSLGDNSIWRFFMEAHHIIPRDDEDTIYQFSEEVHSDLLRILKLLKSSGARFDVVRPDLGWTVKEMFNKGATKILLEEITAWNGD